MLGVLIMLLHAVGTQHLSFKESWEEMLTFWGHCDKIRVLLAIIPISDNNTAKLKSLLKGGSAGQET